MGEEDILTEVFGEVIYVSRICNVLPNYETTHAMIQGISREEAGACYKADEERVE